MNVIESIPLSATKIFCRFSDGVALVRISIPHGNRFIWVSPANMNLLNSDSAPGCEPALREQAFAQWTEQQASVILQQVYESPSGSINQGPIGQTGFAGAAETAGSAASASSLPQMTIEERIAALEMSIDILMKERKRTAQCRSDRAAGGVAAGSLREAALHAAAINEARRRARAESQAFFSTCSFEPIAEETDYNPYLMSLIATLRRIGFQVEIVG
jgi:hypothetical protein